MWISYRPSLKRSPENFATCQSTNNESWYQIAILYTPCLTEGHDNWWVDVEKVKPLPNERVNLNVYSRLSKIGVMVCSIVQWNGYNEAKCNLGQSLTRDVTSAICFPAKFVSANHPPPLPKVSIAVLHWLSVWSVRLWRWLPAWLLAASPT